MGLLGSLPMKKMYAKTPKLSGAKFRGQKALVVETLANCSTPVTLDALAPMVDRNGRYNALLNDWARENGGVKGSVLYHLRALKRLGMVEETSDLMRLPPWWTEMADTTHSSMIGPEKMEASKAACCIT